MFSLHLQPLYYNELQRNCLRCATTTAPRSRNTGIKSPHTAHDVTTKHSQKEKDTVS